MLLKVVNLKSRRSAEILKVNHFREDYVVDFSPILFKFSSFFFKAGLRSKSIVTISVLFNLAFESFELSNEFWLSRCNYKFVNFYKNFTLNLKDMFTFYDLNLIIKKIRTSRKVRKYSKGKLRYKSRLLLLRDRQIFGVMLKLWKICHSSCGEEGENLRHRLLSSFFLVDELLLPETTPLVIQETMLDLYIKETSNSRK